MLNQCYSCIEFRKFWRLNNCKNHYVVKRFLLTGNQTFIATMINWYYINEVKSYEMAIFKTSRKRLEMYLKAFQLNHQLQRPRNGTKQSDGNSYKCPKHSFRSKFKFKKHYVKYSHYVIEKLSYQKNSFDRFKNNYLNTLTSILRYRNSATAHRLLGAIMNKLF